MSRLTGNTRHRISWRGKVIMQVECWYLPGAYADYVGRWRDANALDLVDIAKGNISREAPGNIPLCVPPQPPSPPPPRFIPSSMP